MIKREEGDMESANINRTDRELKDALDYLNGFQFHGFRLGLERMEVILSALGNPEKAYPSIHVAGTNGKGSTCAILNSILTHAGLKTGFYSSPHLFRLNERFRTGMDEISDQELAELLYRIRHYIENGCDLSYFEYTTAVAMEWFRQTGVDIAIFETGLGGRLDATNVITPVVSVITNIALEHQSYLGDTLEKIAFEKAGIIKPGRPVVCGVTNGPALAVIRERCLSLNSPLLLPGREFSMTRQGQGMVWHGHQGREITDISMGMHGVHQEINASLAITAAMTLEDFHISDDTVRKGCAEAGWPGRGEFFSYSGRTVLLDGAHNMDGIGALAGLLEKHGPAHAAPGMGNCQHGIRRMWDTLLWACSDEGGDKNYTEMLDMLDKYFKNIVITEPAGPRKPVSVELWNGRVPPEYYLEKEWCRAWNMAVSLTREHGSICVAGSLYLVGSVRSLLAGCQ